MGLEELTKGVSADRKDKRDPQMLRGWGRGTNGRDREGVDAEVGGKPGKVAVFKDKREHFKERVIGWPRAMDKPRI